MVAANCWSVVRSTGLIGVGRAFNHGATPSDDAVAVLSCVVNLTASSLALAMSFRIASDIPDVRKLMHENGTMIAVSTAATLRYSLISFPTDAQAWQALSVSAVTGLSAPASRVNDARSTLARFRLQPSLRA